MLSHQVDEIREDPAPVVPLKSWSVPQCPFSIEWPASLLDQICLEVEKNLSSRLGEQEIGGVLFGKKTRDRIELVAYRPISCEHAMGPGFVLSHKDEQHLARLIESPAADPELNGLQVLGWYHSHIRSRVFLSERDRQIHSRYFAAPYQVALVIRPSPDGPARAGFFFREPSGEMRTQSSYEEFTIVTPPPAALEPNRAVSRQEPAQRRSAAKPAPQPAEVACPRCGSSLLRRSHRTGLIQRFVGIFGYYPYRCQECLSRSFLKTSSDLLDRARSGSRKRPEERKRAWQRRRREVLLWGGGTIGFLAILYYLIRESGPKPEQP